MNFLTFPYRAIQWMMLTRPIRFTRFGTLYVLFSIGVGAAAINTGNNLLYLILGVLLGLIILSGFLSDSGLWGTRSLWSPVGSLYAGQQGVFECRLSKGWFPGIALTVQSSWSGLPALSAFVPWVPARGQHFFRLAMTPLRRGYLSLEKCRYSTRFPFGFFEKSHVEAKTERWIVYPRTRLLSSAFWEKMGTEFSRTSSNRKGIGSVPYYLRTYRAGDPLRQIDWKTSAKRSHWMVREMEEESDEGDLFFVEEWPDVPSAEQTEDLISFIASILFSVYERGRPVGLAVPGRLFLPQASRAYLHSLLEFLALVDPSANRGLRTPPVPVIRLSPNHDLISLWRSYGR